jgi:hypothetical protein
VSGVLFLLPGTTVADVAAAVAPAVRAELAAELARLDAAVSTRATPLDVQAAASATTYGGTLR